MQGRHSALHITLDDPARATLQGWLRKQKTLVGLAKRGRAILLLAEGHTFAATARHVELRERHVRKLCSTSPDTSRIVLMPLSAISRGAHCDLAGLPIN